MDIHCVKFTNKMRERFPNGELVSLKDKVFIVTGGAMGIGEGIATRFRHAGAEVVIVDNNEVKAVRLFESFGATKKYITDHFHRANVADSQAVDSVVRKVVSKFGRIDGLVNNVGIYPVEPTISMTDETWHKVLRTNLDSTFFTSRGVARQMIEQGHGGRIINIGSVDSVRPWRAGMAAYDASKAAILGFSKNLALELAPHQITVNVIGPGDIVTPGSGGGSLSLEDLKTDRIPIGRRGTPDDVAKVALALAGSAGDYVTGAFIPVDGGWLLTSSNT